MFLVFFPSIFHWIAVLSSRTPLSLCPIHFLCLFLIVSQSYFISNIVSTSLFVICSVQLIFSTLPHIPISKASGLFISSFLVVHVWSIQQTLHSSVLIIRQLRFLSSFTLRSSLLLWNASFPLAVLLLISLLDLLSVVIIFLK